MAYLSCAKDNEYPLLLIFNLQLQHVHSPLSGKLSVPVFPLTTGMIAIPRNAFNQEEVKPL